MPRYFPNQDIIQNKKILQPPKIGISTYMSNSHRNQYTNISELRIEEPISSPDDFLNHSEEISWLFFKSPTTRSSFAFDMSQKQEVRKPFIRVNKRIQISVRDYHI